MQVQAQNNLDPSVTRCFRRLWCGGCLYKFGFSPKHPSWNPHYSHSVFSKGGSGDAQGEADFIESPFKLSGRPRKGRSPGLRPRKGGSHPAVCPSVCVNDGVEQFWKGGSPSKNATAKTPGRVWHGPSRVFAFLTLQTASQDLAEAGCASLLPLQATTFSFPVHLLFLKQCQVCILEKKNLKKSQVSGIISKCKYANSDKNIIHQVQLVICKIILMTY